MTTLSVASDLIAAAEARAQQRETRASLGEIAGTLARIERELAEQRSERRVFVRAADVAP
jgi:hypothetical protein